LRTDESRTVKRALAKSMCESFAISIVIAENRESAGKVNENGEYTTDLIEDMLKVVRREVGRSMSLREAFLDAILHARIDHGERWALVKLGELLFKPSEEREVPFQPKVSVRVRMPTLSEALPTPPIVDDTGLGTAATPSTKIKLVRSDTAAPRVAFVDESTKKKKAKIMAPGQASGMSLSDLTACRNSSAGSSGGLLQADFQSHGLE
jgi:transcription initiation factor TFIID subunit 2